jgi:hypothetical protein
MKKNLAATALAFLLTFGASAKGVSQGFQPNVSQDGSIECQIVTTVKYGIMDFGTLHIGCDGPKLLFDSVLNSPCADAHVYHITLSGSGLAGQVKVTSPLAHDRILASKSVPVSVQFTPLVGGTVTGMIIIETRDVSENNAGSLDTIRFSAVVVASLHNPLVTSIPNTPMRTCDTRDTCIILTNNGKCDKIHITGATSDNTSVTVLSETPPFPADIAVGATETICLHFNPNGATGNLAGNITLATTPAITVPFVVPIVQCPGPIVSLIAPKTTYDTSNCTPNSKTYTVTISQGTTTIAEALTGAGASKFTVVLTNKAGANVTNPYNLVAGDQLNVTVTFEDANATDNAVLTLSGSPVLLPAGSPFNLTGTANGAPAFARVGLQLPSGATADTLVPNGQSTQDFQFVLRDPVLQSTNAKTLSFQMVWTNDVLTPMGDAKIMAPFTLVSSLYTHDDFTGQGILTVKVNLGGATLPAGTQIGTITMKPTIGKTNTTAVQLRQTKFDSVAEVCHIAAKSAGDIITITVSPSGGIAVPGAGSSFSLTAYPNPLTHSTTISFTSPESGAAQVLVVNILGQEVARVFEGELPASENGERHFTWDARGMAPGVYWCEVRMNGHVERVAVVVER